MEIREPREDEQEDEYRRCDQPHEVRLLAAWLPYEVDHEERHDQGSTLEPGQNGQPCGDADAIAMQSYRSAADGLREAAGDNLGAFYQVVLKGRGHDFSVWNHGFYNFIRLCFGKVETAEPVDILLTLD